MRRDLLLAATLCITAACGSASTAAPPRYIRAQSANCAPQNASSVIENEDVRVLRFSKDDPSYAGATVSCELSTGNSVELDSPIEGEVVFSRPAIALAGSTVAYGVNVNNAEGELSTYVRVIDARKLNGDAIGAGQSFMTYPKVGSVVVRKTGSVAWIACEVRFFGNPTSRRPECDRPGAVDRVYRARNGGRARLLDKGRDIDPESLRLTGSRVSWRSGGRVRSASLK
jgi:hypothetical protein